LDTRKPVTFAEFLTRAVVLPCTCGHRPVTFALPPPFFVEICVTLGLFNLPVLLSKHWNWTWVPYCWSRRGRSTQYH
jgi:hypothetical protein